MKAQRGNAGRSQYTENGKKYAFVDSKLDDSIVKYLIFLHDSIEFTDFSSVVRHHRGMPWARVYDVIINTFPRHIRD